MSISRAEALEARRRDTGRAEEPLAAVRFLWFFLCRADKERTLLSVLLRRNLFDNLPPEFRFEFSLDRKARGSPVSAAIVFPCHLGDIYVVSERADGAFYFAIAFTEDHREPH